MSIAEQLQSEYGGPLPLICRPGVFVRACVLLCAAMLAASAVAATLWAMCGLSGLGQACALLLLALPSAGAAVLLAHGNSRWATAIWPDRIGVIGLSRTRTMARADVLGFRVGGESIRQLLSRNSDEKPLKISLFAAPTAVHHWFDGLRDLDAEDRAQAEAVLLDDPAFGATRLERHYRLNRIRRIAQGANLAGWGVCIWGFVHPHPYRIAIAALVLLPLAGIAIIKWSRGMVAIDSGPKEARPNVEGSLGMPAIVLGVRALLDWEVLDWQRLIFVGALAGAAFAVALIAAATPRPSKAAIAAIAFFAAYGGWALAVLGNGMLDSGEAQSFRPLVLGKSVYRDSEHTSYHLDLPPWGPVTVAEQVEVTTEVYDAATIGQPVCVALFPGAFGARWYDVEACDKA